MLKRLLLLGLSLLLLSSDSRAAPVTELQVRNATESVVRDTFAARNTIAKLNQTTTIPSIASLDVLSEGGKTLGFVSHLNSGGFVLLRSDDLLSPIKILSETDSFTNLPPQFRKMILLELREECAALQTLGGNLEKRGLQNQAKWQALLHSGGHPQSAPAKASVIRQGGPLLSTAWDQKYPYNYYCPPAEDGSSGKAYVGCVACAMAQILRFHQYPVCVRTNRTYTDTTGACQGTFSMSSAGMSNYLWSAMPAAIFESSPIEEIKAVGQLIYHCAISVSSNFGGRNEGGTSTLDLFVPSALQKYFGCTASLITRKDGYASDQWWAKMGDEIDAGRPIFYSMVEADNRNGHAAVCDGYRPGNQIHLNLGWSGTDNLWYNVDQVDAESYHWVKHYVVFGIAPQSDKVQMAIKVDGNVQIAIYGRCGLQVAIDAADDIAKGWVEVAELALPTTTSTNQTVNASWQADLGSANRYYRARVLTNDVAQP